MTILSNIITNYTNNGTCSNCGKCCSGILLLTQSEIKRIKNFVAHNHIKEQRHNAMAGYDMTCPFRDEANKICLIYEVRPEVCRKFLCSQDVDIIDRNRMALLKSGHKDILMRTTFFNNDEDQKATRQLYWG